MWNDLWTRDGTLYPPEVELAQHTNHGQSENRPGDIRVRPRVVGVVRCVDEFRSRHVTLSSPVEAYFVYESWPISDQTKMTCFYFRL